ncbi:MULTISPECIES: hypothetical protein [unclassified Halomonas]|uniref:hypothetical protein n=1 Tax=unclassified Halomonas TaxID=2609666 RepID=UPI0003B8BC29|nr:MULTISPECIES: hypothetical protein [unclassified Halomonas]ERS91236.1 hypothetical protein Q671_04545 [Halomonas sp. PBN3]
MSLKLRFLLAAALMLGTSLLAWFGFQYTAHRRAVGPPAWPSQVSLWRAPCSAPRRATATA